jgi:hypothetical protein
MKTANRQQIQGATSVDDDEPNDDSHNSGSVDEESDEDPEAKSPVKVTRSSKRGVPKIAAKVPTQKRKTVKAAARKKKAGKQIQGATSVDDEKKPL